MDPIEAIIRMLVSFFLKFLELFVGFFIQVLQLVLEFARSVAGVVM